MHVCIDSMYICLVSVETRSGEKRSERELELRVILSHSAGAGYCIQVLCKSNRCCEVLSLLSSPLGVDSSKESMHVLGES